VTPNAAGLAQWAHDLKPDNGDWRWPTGRCWTRWPPAIAR
jgi:hypothetical protein